MQFDGYYEKLVAQYKVRTVQTNVFFFPHKLHTKSDLYVFSINFSHSDRGFNNLLRG